MKSESRDCIGMGMGREGILIHDGGDLTGDCKKKRMEK